VSAWCTVAGAVAFSGHIHLPRVGAWTADVRLDVPVPPSGRVELVLAGGALVLVGTVLPGGTGAVRDSAQVRVVGGASGLRRTVASAGYQNVPLSVPLRALLADCGEVLAADSDASALATFLPRWARMAGTAARSLEALAARVGMVWRVLPSGAVWLGPERWKQAAGEYEVLEELPAQRAVWLASDAPSVLPGQVLRGRPVAHVAHHFDSEQLRTVVTYEETA
jgi:hypothetical protein